MALNLKAFIKGLLVQQEDDRTKELSLEVDSTATTETRTVLKSKQTVDRTLDLPDADGELTENAATQTLENKTIDGTSATGNNTVSIDAADATYDNATSGLTATDAQAAIDEVEGRLDTAEADIVTNSDNLTDHLNDTTDAHDASAISYDNATSGLTATDVQAAVDEVEGRVDTVEANKVDGPGTHADNVVPRFDGVDTNDVQASGITIDDSDNVTGVNDLTVGGNLTVNGTTTSVNTDVLDVEDANITVNKNGNDTTAEGAGITVERAGTDGSLVYEDTLASKFKLGALGSEVEVADVSSSQALTNKNLADSTNNVDTASADSFTRATGNQQVVSIPDTASPDNFVLEAEQQVLTNKDIDGGTASDNSRITIPQDTFSNLNALTRKEGTVVYATDQDTLYVDDGVNLVPVGSDQGSGARTIYRQTFETGVSDWFQDTNITIAQTTAVGEVLVGDASGKITKAATNALTEFVRLDSNIIDPADRGKDILGQFEFKPLTGYVAGDLRVEVWDKTNSTLLPIQNNEIPAREGLFQFKIPLRSNTEQIEVRLVVTNANTNAFEVVVDEFVGLAVSPTPTKAKPHLAKLSLTGSQSIPNGVFTAIAFDQEEFNFGTSVNTSTGVLTITRSGKYKVSGQASITFSGLAFATMSARISVNGLDRASNQWVFNNPGAGSVTRPLSAELDLNAGDTLQFLIFQNSGASQNISGGTTVNYFSVLEVDPPTNTISSTESLFKSAGVLVERNTNQSLPNGSLTKITFPTVTKDDLSLFNATTNEIRIPRSGFYILDFFFEISANTSGVRFGGFYRNGGQISGQQLNAAGLGSATLITASITTYLEQDDLIDVRVFQNSGSSLNLQRANFSAVAQPDFSVFGVLGEYEYNQIDILSNTNTTLADTWQDVSGSSFTLTPGTWEIGYSCSILFSESSGFANNLNGALALTEGTSNRLNDTISPIGYTNFDPNIEFASQLTNKTVVTITETRTYKLQARCSDPVSNGSIFVVGNGDALGGQSNPDSSSKVWAKRLR